MAGACLCSATMVSWCPSVYMVTNSGMAYACIVCMASESVHMYSRIRYWSIHIRDGKICSCALKGTLVHKLYKCIYACSLFVTNAILFLCKKNSSVQSQRKGHGVKQTCVTATMYLWLSARLASVRLSMVIPRLTAMCTCSHGSVHKCNRMLVHTWFSCVRNKSTRQQPCTICMHFHQNTKEQAASVR